MDASLCNQGFLRRTHGHWLRSTKNRDFAFYTGCTSGCRSAGQLAMAMPGKTQLKASKCAQVNVSLRNTAVGMVLVMTPAAVTEVCCMPYSMQSVNKNVPKKACANKFRHSFLVSLGPGFQYCGARIVTAITNRNKANTRTGMTLMMLLPNPILQPTSNMAITRKIYAEFLDSMAYCNDISKASVLLVRCNNI